MEMIVANLNEPGLLKQGPPSVELLGVRIHDLSPDELISHITHYCLAGDQAVLSYVNTHAMNLSYGNTDFRQYLNNASINFCDGVGVQLGARLLGEEIRYRSTPPDWIERLASSCVANDLSLYFLGAQSGVAERAARKLEVLVPGIEISGTHHGYFDKSKNTVENNRILDEINSSNTNVLLVGFGMPLQENWITENLENLAINVVIPVGALFDYMTGDIYRAPGWITDHGFEWLTRLLVEPGRLWRRYIIGNPLFFWRVLKQRFGWIRFDE
jgi:N-acetylglucosaminyldiphosphoundecaprenol N-acetyl-beta-D-mannosaminyltransferase